MKTQTYKLDSDIVDWQSIIRAAENIDDKFKSKDFKTTSEAANILRHSGHIIEEV